MSDILFILKTYRKLIFFGKNKRIVECKFKKCALMRPQKTVERDLIIALSQCSNQTRN